MPHAVPAKENIAQITSTGPTPHAAAAGLNTRLPIRAPNFPGASSAQRTYKTPSGPVGRGAEEVEEVEEGRQTFSATDVSAFQGSLKIKPSKW